MSELAFGEDAPLLALLMARALGLGATMTTWHMMFEQEFKSLLGVPGYVHTYAVVPVG